MVALAKIVSQSAPITPELEREAQALTRDVARALLVGTAVSLPVLMALWYAPLLVYLQKQSDGSQTLTLNGKTSDANTSQLFSCSKLSSGFVRVRLTILSTNNLVNLQVNDEDQGTFTYPTYAPTTATDGYLKLYADTSSAEFDYAELRSGIN